MWYETLSAAKLFSLTFFIGAAILVNMWLLLCYGRCHERVLEQSLWEAEHGHFQSDRLGDIEWQPAPTPFPTRSILPTMVNETFEGSANVTDLFANLTCPTMPKTAFSLS